MILAGLIFASNLGLLGSQSLVVSAVTQDGQAAELRINVSPQCQEAMIDLHGQEKWDRSVEQTAAILAAGGSMDARNLTPEELEVARAERLDTIAPIGSGVATVFVLFALMLTTARGVAPSADPRPLLVGGAGVALAFLLDAAFITPLTGPGTTFAILAIPVPSDALRRAPCGGQAGPERADPRRLSAPCADRGGSGLDPGRHHQPDARGRPWRGRGDHAGRLPQAEGRGAERKADHLGQLRHRHHDRAGREFRSADRTATGITFADWIAIITATIAYHAAMFGILYSCWVLFRGGVLTPVVRETAKVTSMVFTILIGSQLLNLVVISFGGEHYIQEFLRSFDNELVVFLLVMLVLFILGFVLDFLEIIYIVDPDRRTRDLRRHARPQMGDDHDRGEPADQSFLTPPFGFALFYLRGVAPPGITTGHIYRGVLPFVLIQVAGARAALACPGRGDDPAELAGAIGRQRTGNGPRRRLLECLS